MNTRVVLITLIVSCLVGCKTPSKPEINDETMESSLVNGVTLIHRHIVVPPSEFAPINKQYRALYPASVINRPGYGGKVVSQLRTGGNYIVLGQVDGRWLALANDGQTELIGYAPLNSAVKSELYAKTVRAQSKRPKKRKTSTCLNVDDNTKACKSSNSGAWILN